MTVLNTSELAPQQRWTRSASFGGVALVVIGFAMIFLGVNLMLTTQAGGSMLFDAFVFVFRLVGGFVLAMSGANFSYHGYTMVECELSLTNADMAIEQRQQTIEETATAQAKCPPT